MHDIVIRFHYIVSGIFFIIALVITAWAIAGWLKEKKYTKTYNQLSLVFIIFLYLQLLTGIILYFSLKSEFHSAGISLEQAIEQKSLRFWVVEHVSLMLFALLLSTIGKQFINQISPDQKKFRASAFYFGISFVVVLGSALMAMFR